MKLEFHGSKVTSDAERLAHGKEHATLDGGADAAVDLQTVGGLRRELVPFDLNPTPNSMRTQC